VNDFKTLKKLIKTDTSGLMKLKVSLLGDTATQFLATAIKGEGISRGYNIDLYEADYNQVEQLVLDGSSELYEFDSNYTIIFQSTHKLLEKYSMMSASDWNSLADTRLEFVRTICESVKGKIIYFNYPEIDDGIFGMYANKVQSSFIYQIRKLNFELMNLAQTIPNFFVCDIAGVQNKIGRDILFDPVVYTSTDMVISIKALPIIASRTLDIIESVEGRIKKCLILDLDNTIWGGIVGDDGWENLQIGHGLGIGKAFTELQEWIKKLKNRGIIICVCSKNDEEKAKQAFINNPEMTLALEDISVFVANWDNKADNIRMIQQTLNIGFDSMVFLDDNPFERNIVRENLSEVTVPELPEDPSRYLEYLYNLNLFETASYDSADKDRTKQYQIEALRVANLKKYTNEADFLKSLDMISKVSGFTKFNIPRVSQLSQRSNQFNLRTVRYTEDQIIEIENDNKQKGFAFTLQDKFGDNGLISVVILKELEADKNNNLKTAFIDSWFMSCRVLKRGMENFTLNTIVKWARENGYKQLVGEYLPTAKNGMVENHYSELGFSRIEGCETSRWLLRLSEYKERECYISSEQ